MSDIIYYKNGEETFRISPPTVGTKCPETKLEVKKMNEIQKVKAEMKMLEKKLSFLEELEKTKSPAEEAYKGVYGVYPITGIADGSGWTFFQDGYNASKAEEYQPTPQEPEDNEWKTVALRFGENLSAIGPCGYYDFTPEEWGGVGNKCL